MEMDDFEHERDRLTAIARQILGPTGDADDVLQEARLRFERADDVEDVPAWLTTVVTRLCIDHLRRRRTRDDTERRAGNDPTLAPVGSPADHPEDETVLADRVGAAMHLVVEALAPTERVAFVLHDVFGYRFDQIGAVLGRSPTAARQLASRARRRVQGLPEPAERSAHRAIVEAFLTAARGGDLDTLISLLAPDAVMRADAVGQQMGTEAVYDGAQAVARRLDGAKGALPVLIDGELGAAWIAAGEVKVAFVFHVDDGVVREVELIADPEVLATMDVTRTRRSAALDGTGPESEPNEEEHS